MCKVYFLFLWGGGGGGAAHLSDSPTNENMVYKKLAAGLWSRRPQLTRKQTKISNSLGTYILKTLKVTDGLVHTGHEFYTFRYDVNQRSILSAWKKKKKKRKPTWSEKKKPIRFTLYWSQRMHQGQLTHGEESPWSPNNAFSVQLFADHLQRRLNPSFVKPSLQVSKGHFRFLQRAEKYERSKKFTRRRRMVNTSQVQDGQWRYLLPHQAVGLGAPQTIIRCVSSWSL